MSNIRIVMGVLILLGLAMAVRLWGQQPEPVAPDSSTSGQPHTRVVTTLRGVLLSTQSLLGSPVRNLQGETVGKVEHVILNPRTGLIRYALVSMGGFLGLGKQTIGVPWEALEVVQTDKAVAFLVAQPLLPPMAAAVERQKAHQVEPHQEEGKSASAALVAPKRSGGWGPETPYGRLYDAANEHTVHGTVVRVGTRPPLPGMASGIELQVQTDEPTPVQVHVGPEWYLERQALELREHEAVQVTGARAEVDGQPVLLARTIAFNGYTLRLRDTQGQPVWSALRRGSGLQ
jgi:sporulation protein YlmC with PRC-barrel domain